MRNSKNEITGDIMTEIRSDVLKAVFKRVPLLAARGLQDFQIKLLPGYTNQNFHLKNDQNDWVLRIPKQETNLYINRQYEAHNAALANRIGIAPECIWRDDSGLSLSNTLLDSRTINTKDLDDRIVLRGLLKIVARLHGARFKFQGEVDLQKLLKQYYQLVPEKQQKSLKISFLSALSKAEKLSRDKTPLVLSHNDLILENILVTKAGQIWVIDWEYASMASPYWDLATLCNAAGLSCADCNWVLGEYQSHELKLDADILLEYRYVLDILSKCWMAAFAENGANEQG